MRREIKSPIAGSVWSHVASVGQRVGIGATLLVVECMKSEFPVDAPEVGVVVWLRSCGETIEQDDVVAALDV